VIKVTDLSKNYGSVKAVRSISFDLNDGEIVGFLGYKKRLVIYLN